MDNILDLLPLDPFNQDLTALGMESMDWCYDLKGFVEPTIYPMEELNRSYWNSDSLAVPGIGFSYPMVELNWDYWNSALLSRPQASLEEPALSLNESCGYGGEPHEALTFVLPYLELEDLLVVERVCRYFRDEVRSNTLLWRSISINWPLSRKINDEALLSLTSKAQGTLESLTLIGCCRIRNDALKLVLHRNPKLQKLSVPGCFQLSIDGIVNNLRDMKSAGKLGIKILRLGDLKGGTLPIFAELKYLLSVEDNEKKHKPRFYKWMKPYILSDDRAIDVEPCPKCSEVTQVYDCPLKICQEKCEASQSCRGCIACIPRCSQCGRCDLSAMLYEGVHFNYTCYFCFTENFEPMEKIVYSECG